ncbi:MAG TPA: ThuA domain-containing protein, partial [Chitinophagaceae bacterium]|nr:ThuA domain-containing protein [Chitinophagaceae bacterium]
MHRLRTLGFIIFLVSFTVCLPVAIKAQSSKGFKVLGFFTAKADQAHISFVHEANRWFAAMALQQGFVYDSTNNWDNLNERFLANYQVLVFFDTRPETAEQRSAFEKYMKAGGGWLGFHFAGFALTPSAFPQNWNWYHNDFIGAGQYKGNTWRPVPAVLRAEASPHPVLQQLPDTFRSAPNEWYSWERDLRKNDSIQILLSIDSSSFPLGTGPKPHEIWHSGYYPVVWTNKYYNMVYCNMGHNDIDYEHKTNKELSFQFNNATQNRLILNCLLWVA